MYLCVNLSVCTCLCVGVFVCIWGKRRRWGEEKLLSLLSTEKKEKKRSECEINTIINGRATVTVYIYMVTVTHVEIYTFLHNFRSTDVEHFWGKMCKNGVFFYFASTDVDTLRVLPMQLAYYDPKGYRRFSQVGWTNIGWYHGRVLFCSFWFDVKWMKISLDYPNSIETRIIKSHDIILLKCLFFL